MKFIDEAYIAVEAGKGGNGACSFLRLKFMPLGGPDGGNGGDGGGVFLQTDDNINTLIDFHYIKSYKAQDGKKGMGRNSTGKSGEDLILRVPVGTMVFDEDTDELIADLVGINETVCVAKGGRHGVGNAQFKSSINRSPRRTIPGQPGESRNLRLELKVLADVGLLGMPNAGKSTLITAMSAARPKIADYPFTTLFPHLGVVRVSKYHSYVMADLPGLIEGAAEGAGLGIQFLKHVSRTRLLYHVLDVAPTDGSDPVRNVQMIMQELSKYGSDVDKKECWLILNKIDLLPIESVDQHCEDIIKKLGWKGKVFKVSGLAKQNLDSLAKQTMAYLEQIKADNESL